MSAEGQGLHFDIEAEVKNEVDAQLAALARRRLEREDPAGRDDAFRGEEGVEPVVSADIEDGHARVEKPANESELVLLESAGAKRLGQIVAAKEPPNTEG